MLLYQISGVFNPGSTKPISTTFSANTQTSDGYLIDAGDSASNNNFAIVVNTFTSVTINSPSGSIVVGQITEYKFTIVLKNAIPSSGGKLLITFPDETEVQAGGSCTAVISSTSHTCAISSTTNTTTVTFSSDAAKGSSLVVTITNGVKNPTVGSQSGIITFASFLTDSGTDYEIDTSTGLTTITILPTVYGTLTSTSVTRVDSSKINDVTSLDIKATNPNPILAGSRISVEFPLDQAQLNVADANSLTFNQLDSSGNVGASITALTTSSNSTYIRVTFSEWCSSGGNP